MLIHGLMKYSGCAVAMFGIAALAQPVPTAAQTSPITLVIGVGAGGSTDVGARAVVAKIEEMGGPRFIVENRTGGGGVPAAVHVRDAAPDGRTLFVASYAPFVVSRAMATEKFPFNPTADFRPVTTLFSFPILLAVPAGSKAKSVQDVIELSKSHPEGLTYASQGIGTFGHLLAEMFASATGAKLVHVPYKGGAQAVIDLVAGRVDMMFVGTLTSQAHIKAGKLRPLAVTVDKRLDAMPDVPTTVELGLKDLTSDFVWFGIAAPAKTPDDVVQNLHGWFEKAVQQKDLRAKLEALGILLESSSPEAFSKRIDADYDKFLPVIKSAMGNKK